MAKKKTRADLEQIIIQGGSVRYQGRVISRIRDLPSDAELAGGDPVREAQALEGIDREIARLQAERAKLVKSSEVAPRSTDHPFDTVIGTELREKLVAGGIQTPDDVGAAADSQLLAIEGVTKADVTKLRRAYGKG